MEVINTLGRRKTAVARVYMTPGKGNVTVNKKDYKEFFPVDVLQYKVEQPFKITDTVGQYDVTVNVNGGGFTGQAGAIRHGITRALIASDETLKPVLRQAGFVTRDAREVERKKLGLRKARKRPQFSKR